VKITSNKNWYLVWLTALLLLGLGKVYEWAYPSFQHDQGHYLRDQVQEEIKNFIESEQISAAKFKSLLEQQKKGTSFSSNIQQFLSTIPGDHVICVNQEIRYWKGKNNFYDDIWCKPDSIPVASVFNYYGEYYFLKSQFYLIDSVKYRFIGYTPLAIINDSHQPLEISQQKKKGTALPIRSGLSNSPVVGYLIIDAAYLAPFFGNILIVFYVLVLFLFYLPFHNTARNFFNQNNYPWGNLILLTGVLLTTSMCQWIVHQNEFYHSILTDKLIHTRFYNYTLFEFSIFSGMLFHLSYFFYKYANLKFSALKIHWNATIVILNYLVSIFAIIIYCFIFNAVFVHSDYYFDLNNVFSFNIQHYILLFDLLIILVAIFLITNKLTLSTHTFDFSLGQRMFYYLGACVLLTPFIYKSNMELSLLSFFTAASIIIWMQDFFSEEYQKNILWLISWIIVISILNSSLILHYQNEKKRYIKNQIANQYVNCLKDQKQDCVSDLIQNCNTNYYDLYFYEDRLLKFSSNVFKPDPEQVYKLLSRDSMMHVQKDNKDVFYLRPLPNQFIVISNPLESTLKGVSLFSYLFTILILISYILSLAHQRIPFLPEDLQISFQDKPSLKNRIQFYVILGIVISFLIIAITTVFFTKRSENQIFRETLLSKTKNLSSYLENSIESAHNEEDARIILAEQIKQSSQMVDFNVHLYNPDGKEKQIYQSNILKLNFHKLLDPLFYFRYPTNAEDIIILENDIQSPSLNAYRNIFFNNKRIAILHVEAIASLQYKATDRLANLVNTLLNIYVFLFLIAASLATFLANSITSPLVNLGEKIRQIRLGKTNDKLDWKGQDEIGELIQNYNQMVGQLDESAELLARNERDMAWREMAKQVAHEIKNPLTPMKLSIQYLQQTIKSGSADITEMAQKVSVTLLEQIENLTKIATEFSNFAKMPQAENEKLVLNEIVSSVHDLFRKREDLDILLSVPIDELYVFADKNQIIRVLNNLINNAIQAIPENKRGKIEISLDSNSRSAIICVRDNGTGIPEEMQTKVFLPNFTSKSSGTGLGLAMCQQIIESANGRIYFKTVPGTGTSFYLELPLMKNIIQSKTEEDSDEKLV
jgi:signal transduction histidine kinase